jgi:FkbH-like protein
MNITQALEIIRNSPKGLRTFDLTLACGFTPLHLQTFLAAHLQRALPERKVNVIPGLYGSLVDTVKECSRNESPNLAITLEWADLDLRLGYRAFHLWDSGTVPELIATSKKSFENLLRILQPLATKSRIVLSTPTLPIAPIFHTNSWYLSESEVVLQAELHEFEAKAVQAGISVINQMKLATLSPTATRYDFKSDLLLGIPYSLTHADILAQALTQLIHPCTPKKGIITDLDDTLWAGLVGEVGPEGVHWDLEHHAGLHGHYQMLLASLSDAGVLVGVASKNDPEIVEKAFKRSDILIRSERVFPMEVHWQAKSGSVSRILQAWNISADAVIFVDDNPAELAEVAAVHSGVECIQFPTRDYAAGLQMLLHLRDFCGKERLSVEDTVRLKSIRASAELRAEEGEEISEEFLKQANAVVEFEDRPSEVGARPLELVNKTNQFNLNGVRYTESEWRAETSRPDCCFLVVDYRDRFGMLGKISVLLGFLDRECLRVRTWVMSCRAFGRRIEYLCLQTLFERYAIRAIEFQLTSTEKNGPLRKFMASLTDERIGQTAVLTMERFAQVCPPLYHTVTKTRSSSLDARNKGPLTEVL